MAYLRNTWYVAAWENEIAPGACLARTLLDEPIVFFRDESGAVKALTDRCPHRFAPLHMGNLVSGSLQCAYHGLVFDGSGQCVANPQGNGVIPRAAKVRAYPLVERHGIVWIWMGDAGLADPALIGNFDAIDPGTLDVGRRYLYARANYLLETDNILDLSHIEYLHASTLGSDKVKHGKTESVQENNTVWSKRWIESENLNPFLEKTFGVTAGQLVDRWLEVRWDPPANMVLYVAVVPTGRPRSEGRERRIVHLFTPETSKTTHYWFAVGYPKAVGGDGASIAEQAIDGLKRPFENEDLPMLEAQQRSLHNAEFWDMKPILLFGDAAAVRARRVIEKLIKEEQAATLPVQAAS